MRYFLYGIVQGVGFRPTVYTIAREMGLRGFVRNNGSNVEVCVDNDGERFLWTLKKRLPPLAQIEKVLKVDDRTDYSSYPEFIIVPSTTGSKGSSIPVDTAICDHCLEDLRTRGNRRYLYPFTNCTDCGARYSVIRDLPYDRKNTSMDPFDLCPDCQFEYGDPGNRRLHAQTISCPTCGPVFTLYGPDARPIQTNDPFKEFALAIQSGKFGVLKSWGGMHILTSLDRIKELRKRYRRKSKPFALMFKDLAAIREFAFVSEYERSLLESSARPIVLLKKKNKKMMIKKKNERVIEEMKERITEEMKERITEEMNERVIEEMKERVIEEMKERVIEEMKERVIEEMKERVTEEMNERVIEEMKERVTEEMKERVTEEMNERVTEEMKERVIEEMKERVIEEMKERMMIDEKKIIMKEREIDFLDEAAPGLDHVGVMLPYSAVHHMLFHFMDTDGFVATSANLPGEAMITTNEEVFSLDMDLYLLHNRDIAQRIDDSLIKVHHGTKGNPLFIRRSRGYIPTFLELPFSHTLVAVGPERNVTGALSSRSRLYQTQYIGNTRNYSNLRFLEHSLKHLMSLTGSGKPAAVIRDLHPGYATNRAARKLAGEYDVYTMNIQHHHAHAASLLVDSGLQEIVALTLDGTGYGTDGTIWGGEVLYTNGAEFSRIATMMKMPMPGGDAAILDPRRMVLMMRELTGHPSPIPLYTEDQERILLTTMKKAPETTSMGRVLDMLSCILGSGCERSYDGEPAMRVESLLDLGKPRTDLFEQTNIKMRSVDGLRIIDQISLFSSLFEQVDGNDITFQDRCDLAYGLVSSTIEAMVMIACDHADTLGIKHVGLTGGVAYSLPICKMFERSVIDRELEPVFHVHLLPGDGGISAGQIYAAGTSLNKI